MDSFLPAIDLCPDYWEIVQEALYLHVPDYHVVAFGSRVTWTAKDYSDLDLAILCDDPLPLSTLSALREDLDESILPFRVDIIDFARVEDGFRSIIREHGVVLPKPDDIQNPSIGAFADHRHDIGLKLINGDTKSEVQKNSWKSFKISDLGRIVTGKAPPTADVDNFDGPFPFITIPDLKNHALIHESQRTLSDKGASKVHSCCLPAGAVMMSCIATIGECGITTRPSFTNQQINSLIPRSGIDTRFLYYVFTQLGSELDSHGGGSSSNTNVSKGRFSEIKITIPVDISEQRAIAQILQTLDDKIELNHRMNKTLEQIAQALFKSWFVDFEPVRAKMEGRCTGLPEHISDLFPDRLIKSELGEIPEGWAVRMIKNCMTLTMGQSPSGHTYNTIGKGLPFFQGRSDFGFRYPRKRRFCTAPTRIAGPDDTLISVRAPVGDINMAWEKCGIGRGVASLRHKSGSSSYTYHSMIILQPKLKELDHTGAINKKKLEALKINDPGPLILGAYDSMLCDFDKQVRKNVMESNTLIDIRDSLLPKLISGEIRAIMGQKPTHVSEVIKEP